MKDNEEKPFIIFLIMMHTGIASNLRGIKSNNMLYSENNVRINDNSP